MRVERQQLGAPPRDVEFAAARRLEHQRRLFVVAAKLHGGVGGAQQQRQSRRRIIGDRGVKRVPQGVAQCWQVLQRRLVIMLPGRIGD